MPIITVEMAKAVILFIADRVSIFFIVSGGSILFIADRVVIFFNVSSIGIFFIASRGRFGYQRENTREGETSGVIERAPEENRRPYEQS
jgi:hypothetical protein